MLTTSHDADGSDSDKVLALNNIPELANRLKSDGRKIVHCHGVFDLLHIGHIRYFQRAKESGDVLFVTVTPNRFVSKGPHRPAFDEACRVQAIAALECVDFVALNEFPTAVEVIGMLRPDEYVKGGEYRDHETPELGRERIEVEQHGGTLEFVDDIQASSSTLVNTFFSPFTPETKQFLAETRGRHTVDEITRPLESAKSLRVLVIGEAIVEDYIYCSALGKTTKSAALSAKYESRSRYAGGALAVANLVAEFCDQVQLFLMLGEVDSEEEWVRQQLKPNVAAIFHHKERSPTITRQQFHESYYHATLFGLDIFDDEPMSNQEAASVDESLNRILKDVDVVLVADYGHQFLSPSSVDVVCSRSRMLAVTTVTDPANAGLHSISRYPRADFVCLSSHDLELECRSRTAQVDTMLRDVTRRLGANLSVATLGKGGSLCCTAEGVVHHSAGLSTTVIDRNGASEAFFAAASICVAVGAPPDIVSFCGNVAGAQAVAAVGTTQQIDRLSFRRHVQSLLK